MNWNERAVWFQKCIALLESQDAGAEVIPRIPQELFKAMGKEEQKSLLRRHMKKVLEHCGCDYSGKLLCFAHDDHNPSMVFNVGYGNFYCHSCGTGKAWDIFTVVEFHFGLSKFPFVLDKVVNLFVEPEGKSFSAQSRKGYRPVLADQEVVAALQKRGVNEDSMLRFGLKAWDFEANGATSKYVVIPSADEYAVRKKLVSGSDKHPVSFNKREIPVTLFNGARLLKRGVVVIVESALDAILLEQSGISAVALNGKVGTSLMNILYRQRLPKGLHLVLLLDNDRAGQEASLLLAEKLQKCGVSFSRYDYQAANHLPQSFLNGFKDVGEAIVAHPARTISSVSSLVADR